MFITQIQLNLSLTDVELGYPVPQCSEDNWRIPTVNDDRTNAEGNSVQFTSMFLLVIMSNPHHSVVTKMTSGVLKSFQVRGST